ncbi:hypothetical protein E4H12_04085 [Candidatus Thorarchaeota archaeon]|nr:MAG: hypothetical protein E4H12_04085 [Candidatus Thorarchaeota archaeon]
MRNLIPNAEEHLVFVAVNQSDPNDRFSIEASSESIAKAQLIYKLGYLIVKENNQYWLCDDENLEARVRLDSSTLNEACDETLKAARWAIMEPTVFLGGVE